MTEARDPVDRLDVLVVEDNGLVAAETADLIRDLGCRPLGPAGSLHAARAILRDARPDVALVDLSLPDGDGRDLIAELVARGVRCVVVSGFASDPLDERLPEGVQRIEKPIDHRTLASILDRPGGGEG